MVKTNIEQLLMITQKPVQIQYFVAPIKIGSHVTIGAGSTISKDIPDKSLVVERSKAIIRTKTN